MSGQPWSREWPCAARLVRQYWSDLWYGLFRYDAALEQSMDLTKKPKGRVYEQIVDRIQLMIREGELTPGDQLLPERQLAETLGVSRAAVREGLKTLVSKGLIEITPGGGAYVKEVRIDHLIDPLATIMLREYDSVFDLLEARRVLEMDIVRMAAKRADEADLHDIEAAALQIRDNVKAKRGVLHEDAAFHTALARATHNRVLSHLMAVVAGLMKEACGPALDLYLNDADAATRGASQTVAIYEAIRDRDEEEAARLMADHLSVAEDMLRLAARAGRRGAGVDKGDETD